MNRTFVLGSMMGRAISIFGMLAFLGPGNVVADATVGACGTTNLLNAIAQGGVVTYLQDCSLTLSNTIVITNSVLLDSGGHSVSLTGNSIRLFQIQSGGSLTIQGFTLTGGRVGGASGGGAFFVNSGGALSLSNCVVSGNSAVGVAGIGGIDGLNDPNAGGNGSSGGAGSAISGGAIYNLGFVKVDLCSFITNTATGGKGGDGGDGGNSSLQGGNGASGGAGAPAYGGAIYNGSTLIVTNCTFTGNSVVGGDGGAGGMGGTGPFSGNNGNGGPPALASGGAIYSGPGQINVMLVSSSTFSGNAAKGGNAKAGGMSSSSSGNKGKDGGLASGGAINSTGSVNATNCTFSGNAALGGAGGAGGPSNGTGGDGGNGGLAVGGGICSSNIIACVNVTFSGNTAQGGTNGPGGDAPSPGGKGNKGASRGGNIANGLGNFFLENTILNSAPAGSNAFGACTDMGNNLSSDSTPTLGASSKKNTNPQISGLANNGGFTMTMALAANSPARDAGKNAGAPGIDQRGLLRDSTVDIGAYEIAPPVIVSGPTNLVVTNGQTAVFTVFASGVAPLRYQWRFNGANLHSATNSSLSITNAQKTNEGNYNVIVSNAVGSVTSAVATLTVHVAPIFVTQPTNTLAASNSDVTFSAQVTGDLPIYYQWRFNGADLPGATNNPLVLHSVQATNAGIYALVATNIYGSNISISVTLKLTSAPTMSASTGTNNTMLVSVPVQSGFTYVVEAKTNLSDPTWIPQVTNRPTTNGVISFTAGTTNPPSRYYRVRVQ